MKKLLKEIYKALPLKRQVFELVRSVWTPPQSVYQHLHFTSAFDVRVDKGIKFKINSDGSNITNEIFWQGIYEGWEGMTMKIWKELSATSRTILDVGANGGIYALVSKAVNPTADVHAFEPSELWFRRLSENCQLNRFDIHCHKLGVSNMDGEVELRGVWDKVNSVFPVIKLDTFIEKQGLSGIDLMKIDVELNEPLVLEGFKNYIGKFRPTIIIEILRDEVGEKLEQVVDFQSLGYLFFNLDDKEGVLKKEHLTRSPNRCWNYLVCDAATAKRLKLT